MQKTNWYIGLVLLAGLWSCSNPSSEVQQRSNASKTETNALAEAITPPFEGVEVPFNEFDVDATKGAEIKLDNGSQLIVPENAFVDDEGKPVGGTVHLKYREYHRAEDVIASGIPMSYQAPGSEERKNFVTTGMFEIEGEADDKTVHIAPEKEIQVNMASYNADPESKFYVFDKATNEWKYVSESKIGKMPAKEGKLETVSKPKLPAKLDQEAFKFDISVDYKNFPELKAYKDVVWQYVPIKGFEDPAKDNTFYDQEWIKIDLNSFDPEQSQYLLRLESKKRVFTAIVTPVLGERDYKKAKKNYDRDMEKYLANVEALTDMQMQSAEINRQVSIANFGTYNHDIFYKTAQPVVVNAEIQIEGQEALTTNNLTSFMVVKSKNAVIRYTGDGYDNYRGFTFDKKDKNSLIVLLPNRKIAVFKPSDFEKAMVDNKKYVFKVDQNTTEITSLKNLGDVIKSL